MRMRFAAVAAALVLAACGGSDAGDEKDVPGVDASGTADTEVFTQTPDTQGVPTAASGGTMADSAAMGGGGVVGGASAEGSGVGNGSAGTTPAPAPGGATGTTP